ncbi:MAG: flagellar motor switch protein FliM [Bermanella sp.]|jgi:flagellar motor switch protein FliM
MAGVLEQEEIDALMGGLSSGELDTDAQNGDTAAAHNFDFSKQHYALRRLIPALEVVQSQYADAIKARLAHISAGVESVTAEAILITSLAELSPRLATPCRIANISATPLASSLFMVIDSDLVFDMVNRYFGGSSSLRKTRAGERFSATETRLSDLVCEELVAELGPVWHSLIDIKAEIKGWECDPRFIDELEDDEALIVTRFNVSFGNSEGGIWLIIPWNAIEPVREKFNGVVRQNKRENDPQWHSKLLQGLDATEVELVAVLAQSRVKLKRALQLKKGDVIAINDPSNIALHIDGIPVMRGSFGTHEGQMAAKITETTRTSPPRTK